MTLSGDLRQYLETARQRVDVALDRCLPRPPACPPLISEAMRYSLFAGGKRLRPILALASAEAVRQLMAIPAPHPEEVAMPSACAIELIHTYSLIHDDLPAMDDDTLRRGRPTSHVVFGEGMAILAGDALLTEAFSLLAREPDETALPDLMRRKLRTLTVIGRAAGATGMVGGQVMDLQTTGRIARAHQGVRHVTAGDQDTLRAMHAAKTGALIRAAAAAGAIMAGATDEIITAIDRYAAELGLAFQIVDDILDVAGAPEDLGKTAGKDAAAGKPTYPAVFGMEESQRLASECIARGKATLADARLQGRLDEIADWVVGRRN